MYASSAAAAAVTVRHGFHPYASPSRPSLYDYLRTPVTTKCIAPPNVTCTQLGVAASPTNSCRENGLGGSSSIAYSSLLMEMSGAQAPSHHSHAYTSNPHSALHGNSRVPSLDYYGPHTSSTKASSMLGDMLSSSGSTLATQTPYSSSTYGCSLSRDANQNILSSTLSNSYNPLLSCPNQLAQGNHGPDHRRSGSPSTWSSCRQQSSPSQAQAQIGSRQETPSCQQLSSTLQKGVFGSVLSQTSHSAFHPYAMSVGYSQAGHNRHRTGDY